MEKKSVRDIDVRWKRVLVRVDFNVPMDETTATITEDSRIRASLPTINYLIRQQAKVVLCSHLGRPKGSPDPKYSLKPVVKRLSQLTGQPVSFAPDCIGPAAEKAVAALKPGGLLLLENVRFHPEEEKNDPAFSRALASLADVYVDDAFGTAHRAHASIVGVTASLPAVAGLLLEKELATLGGLLQNPEHPFATLLGGAKISDKVALMENIFRKVDVLLVGGGMAATFLKARGAEIGQSIYEADRLDVATAMEKKADNNGVRLILPVDAVVTDEVSEKGVYEVVAADRVPKDRTIADIGPETERLFAQELSKCRIIFWNGPMGVYEIPKFAHGTKAMCRLLSGVNAKTIIGGGSTAEAVTAMGCADKMTFVSTGGGASMSFLSGDKLPGVEALLDK